MELETSNEQDGEEEGEQVVTRTIYLNEKINLNEMRKALFAVFSQFGEILDVVMRKRLKLRGQAFIAFRHQESATNSLRTMYGFPLFGMRMCIQYAKTDADAVTKMKGTFIPRPVTEKPRENPVPKKKMWKALFAVFSQFGEILDVVMRKRLKLRGQAFIAFRHQESATNSSRTMYGFPLFGMRMCIQYAKTDADAVTKMKGTFIPRPVTEKPRENPVPKKKVTATHKTPHLASAPGNPIESHVDASTSLMSSHHILFVTNLPDSSSSTMLCMLFSQFPGWREVRVVPGRPDIAFVEFDNDQHAAIAKNALDGFPVLPSHRMHVVFSSK